MVTNARTLTQKQPKAAPHPEGNTGFLSEASRLGPRLKRIRQQKELTIQAVAEKAGIAKSTISKIENDQLSPTFDVLQRLAVGLGIDLAQLFSSDLGSPPAGRRSITKAGGGDFVETKEYVYEALATELSCKKIFPLKATIRARSLEEFGGWVKHEGEEFLIVVSGEVRVFTEYYEPATLKVGDSIYFDSQMGHACVSIGPEDAQVIWVCSQLVLDV
ncbi:Predicted transcriptional regulator [Azospirillum melinis]